MNLTRDRGLTLRMCASLALVAAGYAVLLALVFLLVPASLGVVVCGVLGLGVVLAAREADRLAYVVTRAVAIERADHPGLYDRVHRLAQQADLSPPPVAVVPTDAPNAFSAGTGDRTVVCVTLGLLKELDDDQLTAVLAHEMAHLKNGDSTVLTVAAMPTVVGMALLSAARPTFRRVVLVPSFLGAALLFAALSVPILLVSLPATLVLSRSREYAADRGAVALTGDPVALAEALATLHDRGSPPDADLRSVASVGAFCVVPAGLRWLGLSHPPTDERIRRLRELTADLESAHASDRRVGKGDA